MTFLVFDEKIRRNQMSRRAVDLALLKPFDEVKAPPYLLVGDTLKLAAEKARIPAEILIETIGEYNHDITTLGRDSLFGRTSLDCGVGNLVTINTPPFFVMPVVPAFLGTYCGLEIDESARVLDKNGIPIKGLLAAGEVTGGLHGNGSVGGAHYGAAHAFGRIAGLTAAQLPSRKVFS